MGAVQARYCDEHDRVRVFMWDEAGECSAEVTAGEAALLAESLEVAIEQVNGD